MMEESVFTHPPWRADELTPTRELVLKHLSGVVARLDLPYRDSAEVRFRSFHRFVYSALFEEKLTLAEAEDFRERMARRYEEVTGQPAPAAPPNPLAE